MIEEKKEVKIIKPGESESGLIAGSVTDYKNKFWKDWSRRNKILFLGALLLAVAVIIYAFWLVKNKNNDEIYVPKEAYSRETHEKVTDLKYIDGPN